MPRPALALLTSLLAISPLMAAADHGNFSGTWKMDPSRSEAPYQDVPIDSSTVVIKLTDKDVTIETTRMDRGAPAPFHESLTMKLDRSETVTKGDGGAEVTAKAHWDGPKLVVETVRNIHDSTVSTLYVHTLSPNGNSLKIEKTLTVQHGYQGQGSRTAGHGTDNFVRVSSKP